MVGSSIIVRIIVLLLCFAVVADTRTSYRYGYRRHSQSCVDTAQYLSVMHISLSINSGTPKRTSTCRVPGILLLLSLAVKMRVGLAFLGLACGCCQGFCIAPSGARGWRRSGSSVTSRGGRRPRCCSSSTRMSVNDMIGADVESGGLFDPLGENARHASYYS